MTISNINFIKNKLEEYNSIHWHNKFKFIAREEGFLSEPVIGAKYILNNEWYGTYINPIKILELDRTIRFFYKIYSRNILGIKSITHKLRKLRKKR